MKQHISIEQVKLLSANEQEKLREWWLSTLKYDDDLVNVYIVEEEHVYCGAWDSEHYFAYPVEYQGKLKNHQGTMLPLLSIGEMIAFLDEYANDDLAFWFHLLLHSHIPSQKLSFATDELLETLWKAVKDILWKETRV